MAGKGQYRHDDQEMETAAIPRHKEKVKSKFLMSGSLDTSKWHFIEDKHARKKTQTIGPVLSTAAMPSPTVSTSRQSRSEGASSSSFNLSSSGGSSKVAPTASVQAKRARGARLRNIEAVEDNAQSVGALLREIAVTKALPEQMLLEVAIAMEDKGHRSYSTLSVESTESPSQSSDPSDSDGCSSSSSLDDRSATPEVHEESDVNTSARDATLPEVLKFDPVNEGGDQSPLSPSRPSVTSPWMPGPLPEVHREEFFERRSRPARYTDNRDAIFHIFQGKGSEVAKATRRLCEWTNKLKTLKKEAALTEDTVCKMFAEVSIERKGDAGLHVVSEGTLPSELFPQRYTKRRYIPTEADIRHWNKRLAKPAPPGMEYSRHLTGHRAYEDTIPGRPAERPGKVTYGAWYLPKKFWKPQHPGEELVDPMEVERQARERKREEEAFSGEGSIHTILDRLFKGENLIPSPR